MQPQRQSIAGLDTMEVRGAKNGPAVVLLHGYGANFQDLLPLSQALKTPEDVSWYFPNGPVEVIIADRLMGQAWFPIDAKAMEEAMMRGEHLDFSTQTPNGFLEISKTVALFFEDIQNRHSSVFVGGFSQGAMVATDAVLSGTWQPKGLLFLSGNLVAKDRWNALLENHKDLVVFQSHGRNDPLLSFQGAQAAADLFSRHGLKLHFHPFPGGHEIPPQTMASLGNFLKIHEKA